MTAPRYDTIVLGAAGGVGSAALFHLARRGERVLGLDRFPPGHKHGSSHGRTRIIRQAYFEHADYVPMLLEAYRLWDELGQTRDALRHEIGLLQVGPAEGAVVRGVLASARQHGLRVEQLTAPHVMRCWPGFFVPDTLVGVYEPRAGYLDVEQCVIAHVQEAVQRGAVLLSTGESVQHWDAAQGGFRVHTKSNTYHAERLVVTAGSWSGGLLSQLGLKLTVRRKPQYWFSPKADRMYLAKSGYPAFLYELPEGVFYGLPEIEEHSIGVKVAEHTGGAIVSDPLAISQEIDTADLARVRGFASQYLPQLGDDLCDHDPCLYTLSADEHFIVDRHPQNPQLVFAAGLSGHGFKFTCVLGKLLAEMLLDGRPSLACDFLSLRRGGLCA